VLGSLASITTNTEKLFVDAITTNPFYEGRGAVFVKGVYQNREKSITTFNNCVSNLALDINLNSQALENRCARSSEEISELVAFRFAETHGLAVRVISGEWQELCHRDFPSVVKHNDGHFFLLIRASDVGVLIYDQTEMKTSILSKEQFLTLWSGHAITFQYKSQV
jgi:ABC-type bacteriocin/lantibiotic exporter with double-glycine peptidase domain